MKIIFSVFLAVFTVSTAFAGQLTETQQRYNEILIQHIDANHPGVAVIVSKNGKVVFKGARGLANIEHNIPLTTNSVFRIGSLTKQFTAAAIMLLQEQNKLSVKDNIHKYVPDFPTEGNKVTIENLLTHTSGIANYTDDDELFDYEIQVPTNIDKMLVRFSKHPMKYKTGEKWFYSNTGYALLGKIIEVASGQPYPEFIEEKIFKKLGMNSSYYGGPKIIPNRASGYETTDQGFNNASYIDMKWPHAAGSLLSSVIDMNIWFNGLRNGQLLSLNSYLMMTKPFKLNDGGISNYGYGLGLKKLNKYDAIAHTGGINGFITHAIYIPLEDLYIAVLSNSNSYNPIYISNLLAAQALNISIPKFDIVSLNEDVAKKLMGSYQINAQSVRTLSLLKGKVYSQRDHGRKFEIIPMAENAFYFPDSLNYIIIDKNDAGKQVMKFYSNLAVNPQQAIKN